MGALSRYSSSKVGTSSGTDGARQLGHPLLFGDPDKGAHLGRREPDEVEGSPAAPDLDVRLLKVVIPVAELPVGLVGGQVPPNVQNCLENESK